MEKENKLRTFFTNELTWIGGIIVVCFTVFETVIVPINVIQVQLADTQSDIKALNKNINQMVASLDNENDRLTVLETEVKPLLQK